MRLFRYILIVWLATLVMACDRTDDADFGVDLPEGPTFDESTEWGARMKKFYDDWGVWVQINVSSSDLGYAWTTSENYYASSPDYEYEEADPNYIVQSIDFLENEVMVNLPSSILDEYLGLYIALEGRIFHSAELDDDYLEYSSLEDFPELDTLYEERAYGWNGSRYLLLAPVSMEFDEIDANTLKREWTALIFTEALKNLPNPDEFEQNNQSAWDNWFGYFYYEYIYDENGTHETGYEAGYDPYSDGLVSVGSLKTVSLSEGFDDEDAETGYYVYISKWYDAQTCQSAFADYVGYIMYATPEEKAEIRAMSSKIEENEQLVKDYCKQYLNWDIPELGE